MKNRDILVFFSYGSHKRGYIEKLFARLSEKGSQQTGLTFYRGSLSDLHIEIKDGKMTITESLTGRSLDSFGLVYFELWYKAQQQALAAARYLTRHSIPYFNKELHDILPMTKVGEVAVLADQSISLPHTFISSSKEVKRVFKKNPPIKFPLVVKAADSYGGKLNYLVDDYQALKEVLDVNKGVQFVIQEFIENDCDYRCLVMGDQIALVLRRTRDKDADTHLNNTSAGAVGEIVPLEQIPKIAQENVLKAARILNRSDFGGVDLMLERGTNNPYILEVNQTPQIEIGAEIDEKMKKLLQYIEKKAEGNDEDC